MTRYSDLPRGAILAIALIVAACAGYPAPPAPLVGSAASSEGPSTSPPESPIATDSAGVLPPATSASPDAPVGGAWSPSPIALSDSQVAIVSDACAAAARESIGEVEASLPTALIDIRGEGLATAILSEGTLAIECLARLDESGATVDAVDRLSSVSFAAVDAAQVAVTELVREDDRAGGRTVAFGRVGPEAVQVSISQADGSTVVAAIGDGWWAAWWPAVQVGTTIAATGQGGAAGGSLQVPSNPVEARVGRAAWWLDPTADAPTADSTAVSARVLEEACASGQPGADRVDPPTVDLSDTGVTVTLWIRHLAGPQDCQGNEPFPFTIHLPEPLGGRTLFDGSESPPREAAKPPTG